ncbi:MULTISPECIES: hypothetical protein [Streptomyces]|uniref:hypothetical protein n=1 Tax=Streptomyces TaxID=1883 RepID=UPI000699D8EB|nr:hypothetical protein [Streptomyces sp. SID7805]MYU51296.1 hypothetical protein [Streptomyces sp. SID7805]WSK14034.1 hypothetical protein OG717_21100 [Streptomyces celluloflavus]
MTRREHITDDNHHQAEATPYRGATASEHYVSPAYRRWAEQIERDARPPADTFTMPTTPAELDALSYPDRVRVHTTDRALYDRLTDRTS